MYISGLIPWNFTELAEAVLNDDRCVCAATQSQKILLQSLFKKKQRLDVQLLEHACLNNDFKLL